MSYAVMSKIIHFAKCSTKHVLFYKENVFSIKMYQTLDGSCGLSVMHLLLLSVKKSFCVLQYCKCLFTPLPCW